LGGGGPEGTEQAPARSGDAAADDFDDASRRGGGLSESELARLEETIVAAISPSKLVAATGGSDRAVSSCVQVRESEGEKERKPGKGERQRRGMN
jgi:hypothetical protein